MGEHHTHSGHLDDDPGDQHLNGFNQGFNPLVIQLVNPLDLDTGQSGPCHCGEKGEHGEPGACLQLKSVWISFQLEKKHESWHWTLVSVRSTSPL